MKRMILIMLFPLLLGAVQVGDVQKGYATWYDGTEISETAHPMASGLWFDANRMEAAHRTLPFGTKVKVIRTKKKKGTVLYYYTTEVIITDRGPCAYASDNVVNHRGCPKGRDIDTSRIIDFTPVAAAELGMVKLDPNGGKTINVAGLTRVTIKVLELGTCRSWGSCKKNPFERGKLVLREEDEEN